MPIIQIPKFLRFRKFLRYFFIVAISVAVLYFAFNVLAGNLAPGLPPAPTMKTLDEIYSVMAGTFNSSGVSANANGNALEILKCITTKMNGGTCI